MASDDDHVKRHVNTNYKDSEPSTEESSIPANDPAYIDICVICLDSISEKAVALPCNHDQFDFSCLGTWIQQSHTCPLCKTEVKALKYDVELSNNGGKIFYLPSGEIPRRQFVQEGGWRRAQAQTYHPYNRRSRATGSYRERRRQSGSFRKEDHALEFRKRVYGEKMFSAYVGANRISRYHNITPASFVSSPALVTRAKAFIRRELQVFEFLNSSSSSATSAASSSRDRRSENAEFLLEYIVGILKSIDLKGSTGQAEELLKDFLGRENARLFLHELEAWLRSPYERLGDWDRHVQYGNIIAVGHTSYRGDSVPTG